jgi:hypothetical protein
MSLLPVRKEGATYEVSKLKVERRKKPLFEERIFQWTVSNGLKRPLPTCLREYIRSIRSLPGNS